MTAQLRTLRAPHLDDAPLMGSGCCAAIAPDDLARVELGSWPGVHVHRIDTTTGIIEVALDDAAPAMEELLDALHDVGVEAQLVEGQPE